MTDFLEQIAGDLATRVAEAALAKFEQRLAVIVREQKFFWTAAELAELFGCSETTVRRRMKDGSLGYTRSLTNEKVCLRSHIDDYFQRRDVHDRRNVFELKTRQAA